MQTEKVIACAIVKDEPKIGETIAGLRAVMGDALVGALIHDTGSVDETPASVAADFYRSRPFDDFSSARNACLDEAECIARACGAEWLFMFSAGAAFSGSWNPRRDNSPALTHTERLGDSEYVKVCTVRVGSGLRFVGRTHEVIAAGNPEDVPRCGLVVDYSGDWDIEKKKKRWALDVELLADDFSPRGRFYLGQSFDMLWQYNEAFAYYMVRAELGGWEPERLQAVCGAVKTAPTLDLAFYASQAGHDCADVLLSVAYRYARERKHVEAARFAQVALRRTTRSMFAHRHLEARCREIIERAGT